MNFESISISGIQALRTSLFRRIFFGCVALVLCLPNLGFARDGDADNAFLPNPVRSVSTVSSSGDLNPYGVAFVPRSIAAGGVLQSGHIGIELQ